MRFTLTGRPKRPVSIAVIVAMLGLLVAATSASAAPKGEFANFSDCPLKNPAVESCIYAKTTSGEFVIGKQAVPITNPVILQGGVAEEKFETKFVAAADGNTLVKAPQNVPGGLLDFVNCKEISNIIERFACELVFENGTTGVKATTELAAPASSIVLNDGNLIEGHGTALQLPVKVHLENPFLGSECYIGSNSAPVVLPLTTGTTSPPAPNKPIKGKPGTLEFKEEGTLLVISNNSLVNNSFAAPAANGCGGAASFLIDPVVDSKLGLPAAAGLNTAILNGTLKEAAASAVIASE
jgi:hypothetical protein